ncbi:MAG: hypothetical protein M0P57_09640 [Syntrophales bacterium]|nr:hypothetical protein [Syntrophales bacterium]MDY0045252.1 hypothetical protein [Syntrophales bacterium]
MAETQVAGSSPMPVNTKHMFVTVHTRLHAYARRIYVHAFRTGIGL